jgi:cleavage and polyadenylation specificity factor subunit 1
MCLCVCVCVHWKEGLQYNIYHPILRVDPNMRCAVMLIYGFKLAVIPFTDDASGKQSSTVQTTQIDADNGQIPWDKDKQQQNNTAHSLSSYVVDLRKLDGWLTMRVIDIDFLFGYYEPTLFILCESNRTWVGRYAIKNDTCNSVSLSLNLTQKTNPLIWPVDKLPSDCIKCIPVPPPIGGILIFSVNSLIYINQSVPSYGVSLNSIAKTTSKYPFRNMESTRITLDCAFASFLASDRLLVSLKNGDIYIVTLLIDSDSLRTVRGFNIQKGPSSVIPSCLINCCDNYLFIGSRVGNSVLLKYTIKSTPPPPSSDAITVVNEEDQGHVEHHPETVAEQLDG